MIVYGYVGKSKRKKVPKKVQEQYDQWLKSVAPSKPLITPKNAPLKGYKLTVPPGRETPKIPSLGSGFDGTTTKTGIMKDYHKLSQEDRQKVDALSNCVAPLHKGNYVYVTEGMNPSSLGRKNEVL